MNLLILTGAGISAESGVPTFRDADGLWEGHRVEDVATPEAFRRDPAGVHRFYNARRAALCDPTIRPNAAHFALADLERRHAERFPKNDFLVVTQNIDDLHQRAGSRRLLPMHGELLKARCVDTEALFDWRGDLSIETPHPEDSDRIGRLRPHVVWFGEVPFGLNEIAAAAARADIFVAIGTSSLVYPAAGIVDETRPDCRRVEINRDATTRSPAFAECHRGSATVEVPRWVDQLTESW